MKSLTALLALVVLGACLCGCTASEPETAGTPPKEGEFKTSDEAAAAKGGTGKTKDGTASDDLGRG